MVLFSKLALAAASIAAVSAAPWEPSVKLSTHRPRAVSDDLTVESFHPTNIYETYGTGVTTPLKKRGEPSGSIEQSAASFVEEKLQLSSGEYNIRSSANTETGGSVWIQQLVNGIPVANAVANVALNKNEDVVAFGANFHGTSVSRRAANVAPPTPTISKEQAITSAERKLHGKHNDKAPTLEYYVKQDGSLALTYVVEVQTADGNHWYEAFVDASNAQIVATNDFVAGASYVAVDPQVQDITKGYNTYTNPADTVASPNGWHQVGSTVSTDTSGNNVISYKGSTTGTTKQSASGQVFNYKYDTSVGPTSGSNVDAARVNAFFIANKIHDINYRYGFTEKTFNFQNDNFGKGGSGNDRIKISVQDSSGTNNANFATPADGSSGQMRMYIWTRTTPNRDGDLSNDVIAHEQTHGTTNRMTGGGTGRCLQTTEAGGMGEGWSDAFAEWLEHKDSSVPDFVLGVWVYNNSKGIRNYPYSTSTSVNPLKYSSVASLNEVHNIGEVWANILHNVYAQLVGSYGFAADAFTNPDSSAGNVVFLRLFYDALLLQPCNPTMVQARAAWIQADTNRYSGKHACTLWKAFASRGLGSGAVSGTYRDSTTVPSGC
ncbi:Extracellular metalloproteinase MEP; AltName: Full=Elastinolytic metalloproteinase MEP; AltName: Full=Fungalysin MEP; Flags: Precursor [Serendipita indica DSM 11827]|uniref:Extracellular metalloproteinase n=1 Tax=Serendipita indica (strain DSM 11827) TaxID=1109443 RepID=G4TUS3_SERID|nr:Extracellular metalloproteinase MEP; AltName: Full=Elastinolytic metalloproteinase MEP; AltName: Full=Fungalysin MEP; Flags: Precursor [Serendipita indica DSM 11827]CCA75066.1 probable extracellular elastinolytic metalloproteinase precursor [Serendipita indica DSM 11827]